MIFEIHACLIFGDGGVLKAGGMTNKFVAAGAKNRNDLVCFLDVFCYFFTTKGLFGPSWLNLAVRDLNGLAKRPAKF